MKISHLQILLFILFVGASSKSQSVVSVSGESKIQADAIWLSHEHILVDFIGANKISKNDYDRADVFKAMLPYLEDLKKFQVNYFVDATPPFLGRDPELLRQLSEATGITIITNTGLYGARQNKYIPEYAYKLSAEELAERWRIEFEEGIDNTGIRPGFIKIGVDASDPLDPIQVKIVKAAALTHLTTGLTIASHTGKAVGLWPQLEIMKKAGISPSAFIWVHAQNENDPGAYAKAAEMGCWISLDGIGWKIDPYVEKLLWAKKMGILDHILISHDAGWYDPQKENQDIQPYTNIFEVLIPRLKEVGFTDKEINQLLAENPAKAFEIRIKKKD